MTIMTSTYPSVIRSSINLNPSERKERTSKINSSFGVLKILGLDNVHVVNEMTSGWCWHQPHHDEGSRLPRDDVSTVSRRHYFSVEGGCKTLSDDIHSGSIRLGGSSSHRVKTALVVIAFSSTRALCGLFCPISAALCKRLISSQYLVNGANEATTFFLSLRKSMPPGTLSTSWQIKRE